MTTIVTAAPTRCPWCGDDALYRQYHDLDWGVPCRDDRRLFEFVVLESAQAGLSWLTILRKRENYRKAFADFDPVKVAAMTARDVERLVQDPGIVRHRGKIEAAINNARVFLAIQQEIGCFSDYLWGFNEGQVVQNQWHTLAQVPASTSLSDTISRDLKKRGFRFFGTTICYAYLQAVGVVNDHLVDCFRYPEVAALYC